MQLVRMMKKELILLELKARSKREAIEKMIELISKDKQIKGRDEVAKAIFERERVGTTGIGDGLAIPHARTDAAKDIVIAFARSSDGVDFDALDKRPVNILFMVVGSGKNEEYLKVMAILARLLSKKENRQSLMEASTPKEVINLLTRIQEKEDSR